MGAKPIVPCCDSGLTNPRPGQAGRIEYSWKILVMGDGGVGKTCLINRFMYGSFNADMRMTIGARFVSARLERKGRTTLLVLWDFSGEPRFRFLLDGYIRGARAAFVMFDLFDLPTLNHVDRWLELLSRGSHTCIPVFLVGGKADLLDYRDLYKANSLAREVAKSRGFVSYVPTSSKTGMNVDLAFHILVDYLLEGLQG